MSVTMTCKRCDASIKTDNVVEAIQWDAAHDAVCPALIEVTERSE